MPEDFCSRNVIILKAWCSPWRTTLRYNNTSQKLHNSYQEQHFYYAATITILPLPLLIRTTLSLLLPQPPHHRHISAQPPHHLPMDDDDHKSPRSRSPAMGVSALRRDQQRVSVYVPIYEILLLALYWNSF